MEDGGISNAYTILRQAVIVGEPNCVLCSKLLSLQQKLYYLNVANSVQDHMLKTKSSASAEKTTGVRVGQ